MVSGLITCCGVDVHDVCGIILLTMRRASGALYTQNGGVIFIHNKTEVSFSGFPGRTWRFASDTLSIAG